MNGMYRVESDNSVDADEPIMKHMMEGGVTILKQMERKRRVSFLRKDCTASGQCYTCIVLHFISTHV